jgi:tRNA A-37 threonylcarbamoyl transferase component Bud32
VGRLVGRLHASGFSHRDLKATNLLVRERDGRIEACIIDLDGAAKPWRLSKRRRLANLARLAIASLELTGVTQTMRLRMLRAYLSNFPEGPAAKAVWSELREVFRIRLARKRRAARR